MRVLIILFAVSYILTGCSTTPSSGISSDNDHKVSHDTLIQRIVCFKFKPGTTPEQIAAHMKGFANLKDSISYMLSYTAGPTVKGDLEDNSDYDVMHYSTFHSEEDIRKYSVHPVHLRFIENNKAIWEKVLVINSKIYQ